jgi:hypothetical protein
MYMLKVVITTSNTAQPIIPDNAGVRNSHTRFQSIIPFYGGATTMYLGDATVDATHGFPFTAGSSLGGAQAFNGPGNLLDFYVYGTAADYMLFMVFD